MSNLSVLKFSDTVMVKVSKWDRYEIQNLKINDREVPHITGMTNDSNFKDMWTYEDIDNRNLLDSLVALAQGIMENPKNESKLMLKWCKKYGLPFFGDTNFYGCEYDIYPVICGDNYVFTKHPCAGSLEDISEGLIAAISPFVCGVGVSIYCFRKALVELLKTYLLTLHVVNSELLSSYRRNSKSTKVNGYIFYLQDLAEEEVKVELSHSFANARLHFELVTKKKKKNVRDKELSFEWKARTLFNVAYYQLALYMISPDSCYAKTCDNCGNLFIAKRKNNIYCLSCPPNKIWNRRERAKKKEAEQNAKKN